FFVPSLSPAHVLVTLPLPFGKLLSISAGQIVGVTAIVVLGAINYVGVRSGNLTNAMFTAAKITGLAIIPLMGMAFARVQPGFTPVVRGDLRRAGGSLGVAMIAVLWTYEAWYFVTYAAGEIKEPRRNVPLALLFGIAALTTIYLVVNLAYFYALSLDELKGVIRVAERAATALVGPSGGRFVAMTVVISTFGCNAAAILAGSRLLYAMAADGVMLPALSRVHPRYRTPHLAIVGLTVWSSILALSGTYEQLFTYVMFASILFSVAAGLALFRLRRTMPDRARPYRTWGYPIVPAIFVAGSVAFVA